MENSAICITAGEKSENHVGMEINGGGLSAIREKSINYTYYIYLHLLYLFTLIIFITFTYIK